MRLTMEDVRPWEVLSDKKAYVPQRILLHVALRGIAQGQTDIVQARLEVLSGKEERVVVIYDHNFGVSFHNSSDASSDDSRG